MDKDNEKLFAGLAIGSLATGFLSYALHRYSAVHDEEAIVEDLSQRDDVKRILVCGSGMMVPGLVAYLFRSKNYFITIASNIIEDAKAIASKYPGRAEATPLDVNDLDATADLIEKHDIVVSYVPPFLHTKIFKACIKAKRSIVTASYISPEMKEFDKEAKDLGLIFLNEIGLDPGIDIMSTMKIKDEVESEGGKITKYESWCGGLPAAENADNPLGYKFSWDPKAVFNTSRNSAKFLKDSQEVLIKPEELLTEGTRTKNFINSLNLEGYPNRDSTVFKQEFGFKDAKTFVRGTLRYGRFAIIMKALHDIGYTNSVDEVDHSKVKTIRDLAEHLVKDIFPKPEDYEEVFSRAFISNLNDQNLISRLLQKVTDTENHVDIINSWKFFELFNSKLEFKDSWKTALDALSSISLGKMSYAEGERDLVVMKHIFEIENADGSKKLLHSTMVAAGDPVGSEGFSIMAKTVGYTSAIAINLILEGKIKATGVQSPKTKEFYDQILPILEEDGIKVVEEYK